jgi:hypothetical protein
MGFRAAGVLLSFSYGSSCSRPYSAATPFWTALSSLMARPAQRLIKCGKQHKSGKLIFWLALYLYSVSWRNGPPLWSSAQGLWLQNGDVLCFLWGTNWIYIYYVEENRPPLWSSGQSSWLQNGYVLCFLRGTNWIYICYVASIRKSWH